MSFMLAVSGGCAPSAPHHDKVEQHDAPAAKAVEKAPEPPKAETAAAPVEKAPEKKAPPPAAKKPAKHQMTQAQRAERNEQLLNGQDVTPLIPDIRRTNDLLKMDSFLSGMEEGVDPALLRKADAKMPKTTNLANKPAPHAKSTPKSP
jgi:hypothetical protein